MLTKKYKYHTYTVDYAFLEASQASKILSYLTNLLLCIDGLHFLFWRIWVIFIKRFALKTSKTKL